MLGYQVGWNYRERDDTNSSAGRSEDVINLIESDDDIDDDNDDDNEDDESMSKSSNSFNLASGIDNNTANGSNDRKSYECDICFRKVASSYNLKRHMMIHSGKI